MLAFTVIPSNIKSKPINKVKNLGYDRSDFIFVLQVLQNLLIKKRKEI